MSTKPTGIRFNRRAIVGAGVVLLLLIFVMIVGDKIEIPTGHHPRPGDSVRIKEDAERGPKWQYLETQDEMNRGTTKTALVKSNNTLNLPFPYNGRQQGTLAIRTSPRFGKDVYIRLEQAQIILPTERERVLVQFDESEPVWFLVARPTDYSSNIIFIRDYRAFVRRALKSEVIRIEVTLYQSGNHTLEFAVAGLNWPKP